MKKEVGLWIDYQKAVIVILTQKAEIIRRIESDVDRPAQNPASVSMGSSSDEVSPQQRASRLDDYFKRVVTNIQDAGSIYIFGPDEAKNDLEKQMERAGLDEKVTDIEANDEMSDHQILAKVHRYFPNNRRSNFQLEEAPDVVLPAEEKGANFHGRPEKKARKQKIIKRAADPRTPGEASRT